MINSIHLDDEHVISKKQLKKTRRHIHYVAPEGYITSEEYRKIAISKVNMFCDEHGLL